MQTQRPPICDYDGSDYQTSFWDMGGRAYEDGAEAIAIQRLMPAGGELLLELGAGAGRNTPRYSGFRRIVLLDYSLTQLQQAQARLGKGERYLYVAADIYRLPFAAARFDAATMIRVLHHMADAPQALREVQRVLQPGAVFVLEYANKQNLKAILRYGLKRQTWSPFSQEPVEFAALNFDFHPAAIRRWLRESGFKVYRHLTVSHFRIALLKRILPVSVLVKMDSFAQLTGNWWQLTPSVFVQAEVEAQPGKNLGNEAQALFACPSCRHSPLEDCAQEMVCPTCGMHFAIKDGIYDFRF